VLVRFDSGGATHLLTDTVSELGMHFSVGFDLTEPVRSAILQLPETLPAPAARQIDKQPACVTLRGTDLALIEKITRLKAFDQPWTIGGETVQIALRPLFPEQRDSRVHNGS
jgi:hypothetical protein